MIGNWVYRSLIRFEMKINPISQGGCGRNVPPYQRNSLPPPLPKYRWALLQPLLPKHPFYKIFLLLKFPLKFWGFMFHIPCIEIFCLCVGGILNNTIGKQHFYCLYLLPSVMNFQTSWGWSCAKLSPSSSSSWAELALILQNPRPTHPPPTHHPPTQNSSEETQHN